MVADDDGSFPGILGFGNENVCSDLMVIYCLVGGLNEGEVGDFGVYHGERRWRGLDFWMGDLWRICRSELVRMLAR